MGICLPEEVSKRLMKELVQGTEWATQLKNLLKKPCDENGSVSAEDLVLKIWTSFSESVTMLNYSNSAQSGGDEVCQIKPEHSHLDHSHCDERSLEDSGQSSKRPQPASVRDRRGCYKRRKTSETRKVVSTTIVDGQNWRKYGQKEILNAPYPRAYFRCTRKYDEGCKATKQVQQIQANPRRYEITYIGQHTCTKMLKTGPLMFKDSEDSKPYIFSSPDAWSTANKQLEQQYVSSSSTSNVIKEEENKEEITTTPSDLTDYLSSLETNYLWSDLGGLELSEPTAYTSPKTMSVNGSFVSIMHSHCGEISFQNLDMDFVVKSLDDLFDEP